jgi:hypothetical protein
VPKFHAGLCQMWDGQLPPYEAAIIEKDQWPKPSRLRREDAWLVIQLEGRTVARFNPDEF